MSKYLLVGLLLLGSPAMADNSINDGPVAIRPLTIGPKGYPTHPPITILPKTQPVESPNVQSPAGKVCDYQNQCYSTDKVPHKTTEPIIVENSPTHHVVPNYVKPVPHVIADGPQVSAWKICMSNALGIYYKDHNQQLLQVSSEQCQTILHNYNPPAYNAPVYNPNDYSDFNENLPQIQSDNRRDIGCGLWPIGSDADQDCAEGLFNGGE